MRTIFESQMSVRDFSNEHLLTAGAKSVEILHGLPLSDAHLRQLATDLADEVTMLTRILEQAAADECAGLRNALDEEREALYTGLAETIRSARRHPFDAKAQAAKRLWAIIERRASGPRSGLNEVDLSFKPLFADFDQSPVQMDLAMLDLMSWYGKLKTVDAELAAVAPSAEPQNGAGEDALPSISTARHRVGALLGMSMRGFEYQLAKGRAPYGPLADQFAQMVHGIRSVSPGRSVVDRARSEAAALNA